jgi:DNA-binding protein HU-beta
MIRVLAIRAWSRCHSERYAQNVALTIRSGIGARRQELERGQMTKAELIEGVAKSAGVSKADAERTIGAFFDHVVASAKQGDKVAWPGFGSFSASQRAARTGRNPQTGEPVKIAASTALRFSSSATLKTALNPKKKK